MRSRLPIAACCLAAALALLLFANFRRADRAAAATPTPAPTETAVPTPTLAPGTYIDVQVVEDLNKDGVRQPDEPGVEGAQLHGGCADALSRLTPTDASGHTIALASHYQGRVFECITLEHRFGWLETSDPVLRFDVPEGEQQSAVFLVHRLGDDVMEVNGEPIVAGVPAYDAPIALGSPYQACIERAVDRQYPLFVIVGAAHSGCPSPGTDIAVLLDGSPAGRVTYAAGSASQDLLARGDSMRMYGANITGARIGNVECAITQPLQGFVPPSSVRVFVLSDEVRPGCGAPGRLVRFYRDGKPLDPRVPWRAGRFEYPDVPEFSIAQNIVLPDTGAGRARRERQRDASVVLLVLVGFMALAAGASQAGGRRAR